MKKCRWLAFALVLCMVVSLLPISTMADSKTFTDKYGVWAYEEQDDGSIIIVGFVASRKNVVVPDSIDGKPVKKLGDGLFQDRSDLTMIVIPNGITEIGKNVFSGCEKLEKVELPQSLTTIGDGAFSNCEKLEQVFIPSSVTELGEDLFVNSPVVEVRCDVDSAAAEYLKENAKDVNSFVLIEVTTPQPVQPPVSNGSESAPSTPQTPVGPVVPENAKMVTYQFGQNIEGKREFTVVLIDLMPDMDLMQYLDVVNDPNGGSEAFLDEAVYELMQNRFQLVSVSQFDGKATTDVTPDDKDLYAGVWMDSRRDGDRWIYDVNYSLDLMVDMDVLQKGTLTGMDFNAENKMLTYNVNKGTSSDATVKLDEKTYVFYTVDAGNSERHYADGALVWDNNYKSAYAHRMAIGGTCVSVSIDAHTNTTQGGKGFHEVVITENPDEIYKVSLWENTEDPELFQDSIVAHKDVNVILNSGGVTLSEQSKNMNYDADGELVSAHAYQDTPNDDGTYTVASQHYIEEYSWEQEYKYDEWNPVTEEREECRDVYTTVITGHTEFSEYVVRAENVEEAHQEAYGNVFPNEPDEHVNEVSYQHYVNNPDVHTEGTVTNLVSGETQEYVNDSSEIYMQNHTYVGETGKYVGWDWSWYTWENTRGEDTYKGSSYHVTEYRYESGSDTWTKTNVSVSSKDGNAASLDAFKDQYFQGNLDDYDISSAKYVFDPTTESGADNWKFVEWQEGDNEEAKAIAKGQTTVTANGETINQGEGKEEMLKIGENLEESLKKDDLKNIFDEAVAEIPGAAEVIEETEEIFETQTPPESNTTDKILHEHLPDGSTVTEINPEQTEEAPETEAPAAEAPTAEAPAAEAPAETPAE